MAIGGESPHQVGADPPQSSSDERGPAVSDA
jgi:hypothetical protein